MQSYIRSFFSVYRWNHFWYARKTSTISRLGSQDRCCIDDES